MTTMQYVRRLSVYNGVLSKLHKVIARLETKQVIRRSFQIELVFTVYLLGSTRDGSFKALVWVLTTSKPAQSRCPADSRYQGQ